VTRAVIIFAYMLIVFVMVRPNSQGPSLVTNTGTALTNVIKAGTGGGTW
jgi:hypothetical protein